MFGTSRKVLKKERKKKKTATQPKKKITKQTTYASSYLTAKDCHVDPCEIITNFWIGSSWVDEKIVKKSSVYVPLSSADGFMWNLQWRGEIMYVPITDYRALPIDVLGKYAERIAKFLTDGYSVGMHCVGGHGRTGYMASAVLWVLGVPQKDGSSDPVGWLRKNYCKKAVESYEQLKSLEEFTGTSLVGKYEEKTFNTTVVKGFSKNDDYKWFNMYDEYERNGYDDKSSTSGKSLSEAVAADEYDHQVSYDEVLDPCYDCMHCDINYKKSGVVYECDLGYQTGELCGRYYAWGADEFSHVSDGGDV